MNSLEVLVVTMHQNDLSIYKKMNIQSDVFFANQADCYAYEELGFNGNTARMITTGQRGVGRNRNTALLYAKREICLLADDDVIYDEGYEDAILDAFNDLPQADIIIFNCHSDSDRKPRVRKKIKRVRKWNFMGYGTCRIAIRKSSILKKNIFFSLLFGGGALYSAGEDSLFLKEALDKGLRIYTHPYNIGIVSQETSTWFSGFNEKLFFDKGAWLQAAFPNIKYLLACYFAIRFRRLSSLKPMNMLRLMINGMKAYQNNLSYEEWNANEYEK
ncbi:MAG: glycosyltransferase [Mahellales bacterium]|jgi:glycosyltransferase involved in cell wall biosynthesis